MISKEHNSQLLMQDPTNEGMLDVTQYWRIVKQSKWTIMIATIIAMTIGVLIAKSAVPIYKTSAKILADPQQPNADRNEQYIASAMVFLFYETQYEIIQSRSIAKTVVDKLNLVEQYKAQQANFQANKTESITDSLSNMLTSITGGHEKSSEPIVLTDEQITILLASNIQANLEVSGGKQSQVINISYSSPDPQIAAEIVNAVSEAYIQFGLTSRLGEVKNTEAWLSEQSSQLKDTLQTSEGKLSEYRLLQGMVNTEQQQRLISSQMQSLSNELINAQTKLSLAEEQYLAVNNVAKDSKELYSLSAVLQNLSTRDMVKIEAERSQRVTELSERYGEKHPKMQAARAELKSARENLQREVGKVVENIKNDYRSAQAQVASITKLVEKNRTEIQALQSENFELITLEREVDNNRRIFENFQVSLMETTGKGEYSASNVQIIDRAIVPKVPFKPNVKVIVVLATIFGLILGLVLAFAKEVLNNTFKTPDDIEEKLRIPALGLTPVVKNVSKSSVPEKQYLFDSQTPFAESINTIRTGLLFSNIDNPPKTMLVTSSLGGEGKSTTALNLAAAFSNIGKTLLLEVDLRKPSLARNLEIDSKFGLSDLISNSVTSSQQITHEKNDGKLSLITCGTIPRNPIELLSSKRFEQILASFGEEYDFIILDGPPTLPVSDSCILANKVDGVIFAVKSATTQNRVAKEAIARLQKLNANVMGAVLTVAEPKTLSYYGDHYYSNETYGA